MRLDLGSGPNPQQGFDGVDIIKYNDKIKYVLDLVAKDKNGEFLKWPFDDCSCEELWCSHLLEHLEPLERCHLANEMGRVLVPGGKATIVSPHWSSCRAYGDPSHKWPPVSEFWFYYLLRDWRLGDPAKPCTCNKNPACLLCGGKGVYPLAGQAPHTDIKYMKGGFDCDFDATWGYGMHPSLLVKNQEMQSFATQYYKDACQDIIASLIKR